MSLFSAVNTVGIRQYKTAFGDQIHCASVAQSVSIRLRKKAASTSYAGKRSAGNAPGSSRPGRRLIDLK